MLTAAFFAFQNAKLSEPASPAGAFFSAWWYCSALISLSVA